MEKPPESSDKPVAPQGGHHSILPPLADLHPMALLQPWIDYVPQQQRRLGLFICLALAIHAAICLFLVVDTSVAQMRHESHLYVSVDYPQAHPVGTQAPGEFWDQITDPRVFLLPHDSTSELSLDLPPMTAGSSLSSGALPQPAPPETYREAQPLVSPLEQRVAEALNPPRQPFTYDIASMPVAANTTWQWDDALAQRHPAGASDLPTLVSDTNLTPTRLRVAVNPNGTVEHVLVEPISDDLSAPVSNDVDQQAIRAAQKLRFDPVAAPGLQWGRITLFWNYAAKPREEVVPTPPTTGP